MKKITLLCLLVFGAATAGRAQDYDIKINFKGCKDTVAYLVKYIFDQQYIADTCKKIKNGNIRFKGKGELDKGLYVLVSEAKTTYFDFIIDDIQKFSIDVDLSDMANTQKSSGDKENVVFFTYVKYMSSKNLEYNKLRDEAKGKSKEDSAKFMSEKLRTLNADVKAYTKEFMEKHKGTYAVDLLNLQAEKEPAEVPKASNGRPDSVYQYYYYKNHYFDGVNFKDDRIIRNQVFDDRVKRYFESVILMHPDTTIKEMDKLLAQCNENSLVYNVLLNYFAYTSEQSRVMGFDKVFVHLADKYIVPGKGNYEEEQRKKFKERADIMRNLLLDTKVSDLLMIDTTNGKQVLKMGFDTAKTVKGITDLYYKNVDKLNPMFKHLYDVKAKYTVLVFWAADCGHCKTEIPKLVEGLNKIKGKIDYKVYAVETKEELYDSWKKFIIDNKMGDWINVFDPVHLNNIKERFDIYSTPVIYILDKDKRIKAKRMDAEHVVELLKALDTEKT